MDEQHHGRALTRLIVIPAIYALVKEITIGRGTETFPITKVTS